MIEVTGKDLRVGDTVKVWWAPKKDTITGFGEYKGRYTHEAPWKGARIAYFALLPVRSGMTILAGDRYEVLNRVGVAV